MKIILSAEMQSLKNLYKDGGDNRGSYKDLLKYGRKRMSSKENLISFQLTEMADLLPPLVGTPNGEHGDNRISTNLSVYYRSAQRR